MAYLDGNHDARQTPPTQRFIGQERREIYGIVARWRCLQAYLLPGILQDDPLLATARQLIAYALKAHALRA